MEFWVDMWDFGCTTLIFVWGTLRFHKSAFRCKSQMKSFRDTHGWSRIKFIPHADFYVHNPTTLTVLFKSLLIQTEEDKVKYSEDLQREYSDETNRKRHNVKNAVQSKYKSEWNCVLHALDNGFTHISQSFAAAPTQINGWVGTCTTALVTLTILH